MAAGGGSTCPPSTPAVTSWERSVQSSDADEASPSTGSCVLAHLIEASALGLGVSSETGIGSFFWEGHIVNNSGLGQYSLHLGHSTALLQPETVAQGKSRLCSDALAGTLKVKFHEVFTCHEILFFWF